MIPTIPNVNILPTSIINDHFQSPLVNGTNGPAKKVVQEKPTGASLVSPFLLLSLIVAKAT